MIHKIPPHCTGRQWVYLCGASRRQEAKRKNYGDWLWRDVTCPACLALKGKKS